MKSYKYTLQERLNYYVECKNNWSEYFKHEEVNPKAQKRLFGNNIIFYLVMELYFLLSCHAGNDVSDVISGF